MKWEVMGMKMPKRRKMDQEIIACLASDWLTHIHLKQDRKLLSSSSTWERLCACDVLLGNSSLVLLLVVTYMMMPPLAIDRNKSKPYGLKRSMAKPQGLK
ncbi:hypothetical protein C4D60_Mb05t22530 [Musa balbisiana]|uniref:Uncharacterized protein n=1 Tax=Musa balbisiana TaxID=52838 RepID=A0A4S8JY42_MUSBA|nr:hypothetical protein C4D60_Mb05t22530 [Musa balbisiana]